MNYYEHHLGDYDGATAHLTWLEDCAYRRLICLYYRNEAPIPADLKKACRLVRAATKPERDAVEQVLQEFFQLGPDGWHNERCDADLAHYHESEPDREAKRENAKERQRRARERRRELFEALRGHNIVPAWDTPTKTLESTLKDAESRNSAAPVTPPVTAPVTRDNTATQTPYPDTRLEEIQKDKARASAVAPPPQRAPGGDPPDLEGHSPTPAGAVCKAIRAVGLAAVNPGDPRLLALLAQGATEAEFVGIATEAVEKSKGWAWVLHVLQARRTEAAGIALAAPPTDPSAWRNDDRSLRAMADQLDVPCRPDERIDGWQRRIFTAWQRAGQPPLKAQEQRA